MLFHYQTFLQLCAYGRVRKKVLILCFALAVLVLSALLMLVERYSGSDVHSKTSTPNYYLLRDETEQLIYTNGWKEIVNPEQLFLDSFTDVISFFRKEIGIADQVSLYISYAPPADYGHMPRLSNGYIATMPYNDAIFKAGLYNGARLAKLPAFLNHRITTAMVDGTTLSVALSSEYTFHVLSGIFRTKISSPLFEVTQLVYCHRYIPNIFVMDISVKRPSNIAPRVAPSLSLRLQEQDSDFTDVIKLELNVAEGQSFYKEAPHRSYHSYTHWFGQTRLPEWMDSNVVYSAKNDSPGKSKHGKDGAYVSIHYDKLPMVLELERGQVAKRWTFLASYGGSSKESLKAFQLGKQLAAEGKLLGSHAAAWLKSWQSGSVFTQGNSTLLSAVLSSQYAIFSAIPPTKDNNPTQQEFEFPGVPLCGIAPLNLSACQFGLVTDDQEYAIIPALFGLQPFLVRSIVSSRISHLASAIVNAARIHSKAGAAFPWITANSGTELHSQKHLAKYNLRTSGLVALAMALHFSGQVLPSPNIRQMVIDTVESVAKFYADHVYPLNLNGETVYILPHVIGPYPQSFIVNNSLSVNLLAKFTFSLASRLLADHPDAAAWFKMANAIQIPIARNWWNVWKLHDNFLYSSDVRLSDFLFLRPEFGADNLPYKTLSKMLETYLPLYGEYSAFGLGLFAINYLSIGSTEDAQAMVDRILRQFTSTFYNVPVVEVPTVAETASAGDPTSLRKRNSAFWIWLCGSNEFAMTASNCLPSAAALPFTLTWGWLGLRPSNLSFALKNSSRSVTDVVALQPVTPLPLGVSKIELKNWRFAEGGSQLSVVWDGSIIELGVVDHQTPACRYTCQAEGKKYRFKRRRQQTCSINSLILKSPTSKLLIKRNC